MNKYLQKAISALLGVGLIALGVYAKRSRLTKWVAIPILVASLIGGGFLLFRSTIDTPFALAAQTFATWNPSDKAASITLSGSDLIATFSVANGWGGVRSTIGKSTGKWYWEYTITVADVNTIMDHAVAQSGANLTINLRDQTTSWSFFGLNGNKSNNSYIAYGSGQSQGDVVSIAIDMDAGKIWWGVNGTWQASGDPGAGTNEAFSNLSGTIYAAWASDILDNAATANFGASAFAHSVPSGFNAGLFTGEPDVEVVIRQSEWWY